VPVAVALLCGAISARADRDSPLPDWGSGYLTTYLDNDLFGHTDRDYTS
jgi:hypothetical protein